MPSFANDGFHHLVQSSLRANCYSPVRGAHLFYVKPCTNLLKNDKILEFIIDFREKYAKF